VKKYRVEKLVALSGKTAAGQSVKSVGAVWVHMGTWKNRTVAETQAKRMRTDERDTLVRVVEKTNG
jgi:hypothetical protein